MTNNQPTIPAGYVTTAEVISQTGIGDVQLHRWCQKGVIPHTYVRRGSGRPILYRGSGSTRIIPDVAIPRIALAVKVQQEFKQLPG